MCPESRFLCLLLALQAAAKLPCSEQDVIYKDPEVIGAAPNGAWVLDSLQCSRQCEISPICAFFSFVPSNLPGAGECWLLGEKAKAEKREGVISGRKVCTKEISGAIPKCHAKHQCPAHWSSGLGGFLCTKGHALGACRHAIHGYFPSDDCEVQCSIGIVDEKEAIAEEALKARRNASGKEAQQEQTITDSNILTVWLADRTTKTKSWDPRTLVLPQNLPSGEDIVGRILHLWSDELEDNELSKIYVVKPFVIDYPGEPSLHVLVERHPVQSSESIPVLVEVKDSVESTSSRKWRVHWVRSPVTFSGAISDLANEGSAQKVIVYDQTLDHDKSVDAVAGDLIQYIVPKEHFKSFGGQLNGWIVGHDQPGDLSHQMKNTFTKDAVVLQKMEAKLAKHVGRSEEKRMA
mmetsp:Transcript_15156/g.17628  ORF Transcript_15156/g.17628 Transcript_15156/m.17628 type:complete len:406 (-) Transcript_15156:2-1219(-)